MPSKDEPRGGAPSWSVERVEEGQQILLGLNSIVYRLPPLVAEKIARALLRQVEPMQHSTRANDQSKSP